MKVIDTIFKILNKNKEIEKINLNLFFHVIGSFEKSRFRLLKIEKKKFSNLDSFIKKIDAPESWGLGLASLVKLPKGKNSHIPQIDFKCPPSKENVKKIKEFMNKYIKIEGHLYQTPNSYHFFGFHLLNDKEWINFLDSLIVYDNNNLVDKRWVGFSLRRGMTNLRISPTLEKKKTIFKGSL